MAKKQKSGLYRARVKIGVNADGSDQYKYISGRTQRELEAERRHVQEYYIGGKKIVPDKPFGVCAQEWFERLKLRVENDERSEGTLESYRTALNKDILPVFGDRFMRAIQPNELQKFVDGFSGMSQSKITYITASLDKIFDHACKNHILDQNPFEHIEKPSASEAEEKRALTPSERRRIRLIGKLHRDGAYIACMYYLGARPGEIHGLQWGDFDWRRNLVHIQRDIDFKKKGPNKVGALKNKKSNRWVPVPQDLRRILYPMRKDAETFVFTGEINKSHIAKTTAERLWTKLMVCCKMADRLPEGANKYRSSDIRSKYKAVITPHCMRHNYVTMCWENGIDVYTASKLVGHKSIKTTMDIYTHLSEKQMAKASAEVAKMFRSGR